MGKRIIQQRRGRGSSTYRVRKKAFKFKVKYPKVEGKGKVLRLICTASHSAPLAKIRVGKEIFYNIAPVGIREGKEIEIGKDASVRQGNILFLKDIPPGTSICNIEVLPGDGGKLVKASGLAAKLVKRTEKAVVVLLPSKKEKVISEEAKATIGVIGAGGRKRKPIVKAGKRWHIMHAKGKLYPRTSAVKMNIVDHPFGSGRGKRIKAKIPKRHAPPGKKVGLLRPKRTGKRKGK